MRDEAYQSVVRRERLPRFQKGYHNVVLLDFWELMLVVRMIHFLGNCFSRIVCTLPYSGVLSPLGFLVIQTCSTTTDSFFQLQYLLLYLSLVDDEFWNLLNRCEWSAVIMIFEFLPELLITVYWHSIFRAILILPFRISLQICVVDLILSLHGCNTDYQMFRVLAAAVLGFIN